MESDFDWSEDKNRLLVEQRGISFERVISAIERGGLVDVLDHPNQEQYRGQMIYVVNIEQYLYLAVRHPIGRFAVPEDDHPQSEGDAGLQEREVIVTDQLNAEEREILEKFERDELRPATGADREMAIAPQAARNTFKKTRRVNLRVTERDYNRAHARAREEGIPYQTLLSSVIHKYLSGRLTEKR